MYEHSSQLSTSFFLISEGCSSHVLGTTTAAPPGSWGTWLWLLPYLRTPVNGTRDERSLPTAKVKPNTTRAAALPRLLMKQQILSEGLSVSPYRTQTLVLGLCSGAGATALSRAPGNEGLFCLTGPHSLPSPTAVTGAFWVFCFLCTGQNAALHARWQEWANAHRFPGPGGETAPLSNHTAFGKRTGSSPHVIIQLQRV